MSDATKLSDALGRTQLVPQEYAPMVQTGEITGDIPGQLFMASQATQNEFETQDKFARGRVGCWILLLFLLGGVILFGMFYGDLYPKLFKEIMGE
jgi:type II secretory pathway component PulF